MKAKKIRNKIPLKNKLAVAGVILVVFLVSLLFYKLAENKPEEIKFDKNIYKTINNVKINDNLAIYPDEDIDKVYNAYITVYSGSDAETGEKFNLTKLNNISALKPDPELDASAYVVDPQTGKIIAGSNKGEKNAVISQRGQSTRRARQKSYKLKLSEQGTLFKGQATLNLNKHYSDKSRVAQKFSFDLIRHFPNMVSLRTNFFRVYIKDATVPNSTFVDYGLFTHVEQPNKSFLTAHGLDPNGTLYKPTDFEFFEEEAILPEDSEKFNLEDFEKVLKIRENPNNKKLAQMISDINNENLSIEDVFEKYFDRDNYLTWCAMNFIVNNYDTMSRNFLLYSPSYSEKWYFLPWDYDASLTDFEKFKGLGIEQYFGLSRYFGTILHKRFFLIPENVRQLEKKLDELYNLTMKLDIDKRLKRYATAVGANYEQSIDKEVEYIPDIKQSILNIKPKMTMYYNLYYKTKDRPMPFFLGREGQAQNGEIILNWSPSYDLQGDSIAYEVTIFKDLIKMNETTLLTKKVFSTTTRIKGLLDGIYYWRVKSVDNKGNFQISFDRIRYGNEGLKSTYFGVKKFEIKGGKLLGGDR